MMSDALLGMFVIVFGPATALLLILALLQWLTHTF